MGSDEAVIFDRTMWSFEFSIDKKTPSRELNYAEISVYRTLWLSQPAWEGLPCRRIGSGAVRGDAVGREEPGIDDGEIGRDDGEEKE